VWAHSAIAVLSYVAVTAEDLVAIREPHIHYVLQQHRTHEAHRPLYVPVVVNVVDIQEYRVILPASWARTLGSVVVEFRHPVLVLIGLRVRLAVRLAGLTVNGGSGGDGTAAPQAQSGSLASGLGSGMRPSPCKKRSKLRQRLN
jgi:hypothetical protein